ncbi:MAG: DUF6763 family protein [Gammaproteobacteria bacterium]
MNDQIPVQPVIGNWYRDITGEIFEIVAIDEDDATIEIQHFDGTVEEIDLGTWNELPMETAAQPEDWSGSLDIEREDYGVDLVDSPQEDWISALDFLDSSE